MKRLFTLLTVIASAAILFSCGGSSSSDNNSGDTTPPALSGESLAITKAAGAAVSGAVSTALNSIKSSARKTKVSKAEEGEGEGGEGSIPVSYTNDDKSLIVSGTKAAMVVTMKDYKSESDGHKLVLNGEINVATSMAEAIKTQTFKGTLNLTFDGAAHVIIQDYKTDTDYEKETYTTSGTVTFDGIESSYSDSGSAEDGNKLSEEVQIAIFCGDAAMADLIKKITIDGYTDSTINITKNDAEPAAEGLVKRTLTAELTAYSFSGIEYPGDGSKHSGTFTGTISYTTTPSDKILTKVQIYNATALVVDGKAHTYSYEYNGTEDTSTMPPTYNDTKSGGIIDGKAF